MMRWEYKTLTMAAAGILGGKVDPVALDNVMNALGDEGWELATGFDTNQAYGMSRDVVIIFRRPKN